MLGKSAFSTRWLRLPSLLIVLLTILFLVTSPRAAGDISADQVLGQAVFTLNAQNLIDGAGFNFTDGSIGNITPADGVAIDVNSTPEHLYIADSLNSRILGWNNADSFAERATRRPRDRSNRYVSQPMRLPRPRLHTEPEQSLFSDGRRGGR